MKSRKLSIHVVVVFIALMLVDSSANAQKGRYDRSREGRGGAYGKSYVNHNWN
jgi:hypothetical protein